MEPIRVLHVVAIMDRGGLETMIMNHYREIDRSKIQFDFLVHRSEKGVFDDEIRKLGGRIYYLPRFNPFSIRRYNNELDRFFKKNNEYKIVHAQYNALSMWCLRAAWKHGVPVRIAHSHLAFPKLNYQSPIYWYARKKINKYCNHRFACSKEAAEWLYSKEFASQAIIFNNAIPLEKFIYNEDIRLKTRDKLNLNDKIVLGHVGRFNPSKNHQFLLKVFYEVYKKNPNSHLILVGDGTEKSKLIDITEKLNIEKNVSFLGVRDDVADIMQAMDIFVFPSLFEALPVTLVEAQASGLRNIVSNSLTKDICFTNLIDFISLDESVEIWANQILKYSNNYERKNMYENIKASGYDVKENAKWLENFYIEQRNKFQ